MSKKIKKGKGTMKKRFALLILATLALLCASSALAQTYTTAFGCELELPDGAAITDESWTPDDPNNIYRLTGTYHNGEERFALQFVSDIMSADFDSMPDVVNRGIQADDVAFGIGLSEEHMMAAEKTEAFEEDVRACLPAFISAGMLGANRLPTATVATKSSPLTMRDMPNADGRSLGEIPKGETVTVLASGSFPLVEYNEQRGYVNGQYLQLSDGQDEAYSDWIDTGIYARIYPSSVSQSKIIALKKRAADFEKQTRTKFVLLIFADPNDNRQAAWEELYVLMNDYNAKQGDYDGILGIFINTARNTRDFICGGRAADILLDSSDSGEPDECWEKIEAAYDEKLVEGYDQACFAYMDAIEEVLK